MVSVYNHPTPQSCAKAGCTHPHLSLRDLAASVGRAWKGDRAGKNLRDRIRSEVIYGRSIKGTAEVPSAAEIASNSPGKDRKDFRKVKNTSSPGISRPTLASLATKRLKHYWHPGDPDILAVKRLLIAEIPADPHLGQDCAICLGSVFDTNNVDEVYGRDEVCRHAFHLSCIKDWFRQCGSVGQAPTCPLCVREHPPLEAGPAMHAPSSSAAAAGASSIISSCGVACAAACSAAHPQAAPIGGALPSAGPSLCAAASGSGSSGAGSSAAAAMEPAPAIHMVAGGRSTRKRPMETLCELEDPSKSSLKKRREEAASRRPVWAEGDLVEARWHAKLGGDIWFPGRVERVHELAHDAPGGPGRAYDIKYEDGTGDYESEVLPRYVRARSE